MAATDRKICIVLDTNAWLSDHMLRSRLGASLVHTVVQLDAVIGFPEVVERELKPRWDEQVRETLRAAEKYQRILSGMIGDDEESLPSEKQVLAAHDARLAELRTLLFRVPLTLVHASRALDRVIYRRPPSGKNDEQFRDAAIWEAVLELAAMFDVHFITADGNFFEHRDPSKGAALAPNLVEDCKGASGKIAVYRNIQQCLAALEQDVKPIPERALAEAIEAALRTDLAKRLASTDFVPAELIEHTVNAFATGKPVLALTYKLVFALRSKRDSDDRLEPKLINAGECTFDPKAKVVSDLETELEEIRWRDAEGKQHRAQQVPPYDFMAALLRSDADPNWIGNTNTLSYLDQLVAPGNFSWQGSPSALYGTPTGSRAPGSWQEV